ncbi:MAG: response regulator transcription factor [Kiritimatiellaeota bacterium]|nr:response regulator transcription factor [Kiritimatiellota bacterium]
MRVLLVEDERKVASFIAKGLREEGMAVDHVSDGKSALAQLDVYEYDLLVTDIMMLGMSGIELIREIRMRKAGIPILALTAKDSVDDKVLGLDTGADDYMTKPFVFAELLARIRALMRRPSALAEPLKAGDLIMDPVAHVVTRAGEKVDLTQKEYALLEFLLSNKGRVLSRTSIIESVWDMHFDSDTNLVDVLVSYLRGKIDRGFDVKLIHSVRGVGYVLEDRG